MNVEVKDLKGKNEVCVYMYLHGTPEQKEAASERLIVSNKGLIIKVMNDSFATYRQAHREDLFQCGVVGLLKAARAYRFGGGSTYASVAKKYILHEMYDYISEQVHDCTPYYFKLQLQVKKAVSEIEREGEVVTVQAVSKKTGLSMKVARNELYVMNMSKVPFHLLDENIAG